MTTDIFGWKRRQKAKEAAESVTAQDDAEAKAEAEAERKAREAAEAEKAAREANTHDNAQTPAGEPGESQDDEQTPANTQQDDAALKLFTPEMVDTMAIEDVKEMLDAHDIKYAHNTGEEKLRERLKNAIG